jgi:hypothetical protein
MKKRGRCLAAGFVVFMMAEALPGQAPVANVFDVGTIADIVRVSYEVISGPAGTPRQWRRDSTLYSPTATFVAMSERDGKPVVKTMAADEYRRVTNEDMVKNGLFEREIGSRIERFGNVATVRSISEARRTPNGPVDGRWVNYFSLYWDGGRWWITGIVWDEERPNNPIPNAWIGVREEVLFPTPVVRAYSTADSVAVVKPLVNWLLKDPYSSLTPGARIFAGDRLAFAALDSVSRARGLVLEPPLQPGTRIGCPYKMISDSAGLNEKATQKGLFVGFKIFSLSDSTAIAGFGVGCGLGVAPLSAYATATKFRLKRVNRRSGFRLEHEWVIESVIDSWVT